MFDHKFHRAIKGYVSLNNTMKQNPSKVIPCTKIGRNQINKIIEKITEEEYHTSLVNIDFNYYMKNYFEYYQMTLPDPSNQ